MNEAEHQINDL